MSTSHRHSGGHQPITEDPAFQPRSCFDFEEEMNHNQAHMASYNTFPGSHVDFDMSANFDDEFNSDYFQHHSGHNNYGAPMSNARMSNDSTRLERAMGDFHGHIDSPSKQSTIVSNRNGQVAQVFGQITPPDEFVPHPSKLPYAKRIDSPQAQPQDPGKLSNEQRARNAANTRHSRTKCTKKKTSKASEDASDSESQKQKNLNVQREKNRVAAAKCRAKKKTANEQQEEMANEFGATNSILSREIRDLKNQRTELQNYLLAHRPGTCECHGIHDYNLGQAQRLVLNARRQVAMPQASSPSQESALSTQSCESDRASMMLQRPSPMMAPETMGMHSRSQSFNTPMDFAFNPMLNQAEMREGYAEHNEDEQEMHREFAEFLKSSPGGGRAGSS